MKKSFLVAFAVSAFCLSLTPKAEAIGLLYTNASYPVTATGVTSPDDLGALKQGSSKAVNILGIIEVGDAGINKAAGSAGITKINYIDVNETSLLILFKTITTTVYGE